MTSPVTEQGKAALRRYDERVDKLAEDVHWTLRIKGPTYISELVKVYSASAEQDEVREAVWRLIDAKRVQLMEDRRLTIYEEPLS